MGTTEGIELGVMVGSRVGLALLGVGSNVVGSFVGVGDGIKDGI